MYMYTCIICAYASLLLLLISLRASWEVRLLLVIITVVGLIVFDLAYTAVVINYSIECQLVIYYIQSICGRVIAKEWEFDVAVKVTHVSAVF